MNKSSKKSFGQGVFLDSNDSLAGRAAHPLLNCALGEVLKDQLGLSLMRPLLSYGSFGRKFNTSPSSSLLLLTFPPCIAFEPAGWCLLSVKRPCQRPSSGRRAPARALTKITLSPASGNSQSAAKTGEGALLRKNGWRAQRTRYQRFPKEFPNRKTGRWSSIKLDGVTYLRVRGT